ncbi:MSHA biogenesis protein MshB [Vibrio sp. 10N.286.49.B3]|uniref:prepilin-type N-terminal cleavage/methylation domain-containing protein n=1 Tax=Vibrio sp. 10N.286.49.B3 TaxID=1880855 RepID=UPI000C83C029|nr:prepilin-type N-terminal cleavage/methylation domain-containing protein [Vibrio sp. 10N.286.49.B3]PMH39888.1 MSHA biogenesis protein MshB [Vibrio sp. 10N.286.49.B3]
MNRVKGFTLVELVIVIVVLGLLAAAALPRFLNVTDQAKQASIEGVAGGFATAVLSARAQWEAEARPVDANGDNLVDYDGQEFWLTTSSTPDYRDGYPAVVKGDETGESDSYLVTVDADRCIRLMETLLQNPPKVTLATSSESGIKYFAELVPNTDSVCRYTQNEGKAHYFDYDVKNGSVNVVLKD